MAAPVKNIVLVHGAWVDGSGWKPVYEILVRDGYNVTMVQEPETSFDADVAAAKRILGLQPGPCILVGHSYGGSIITEAGVDSHVVGLVYVAAHAPDVGEDEGTLGKEYPQCPRQNRGRHSEDRRWLHLSESQQTFPNSLRPTCRTSKPCSSRALKFLAAAEVFNTPLTAAAWRTKPTWGVVALADQIINPDLEKWYYKRAHSHVTEIAGASHSVYESHPKEVAAVIEQAAEKAQN